MRLFIRSSFFLIIFSIFTTLYFVLSAEAQTGQSLAQTELARATAARQGLEQQLNNAQATLSEVEEAKGAAERQLAAAQDALASATAALQAAEQAVQQEAEQRTSELAIAEQAVQDAQQRLELVNTELMTADRARAALQEQLANTDENLASLKARKDEEVRILNDAKAKLNQLILEQPGDAVASNNDKEKIPEAPKDPMRFCDDGQDFEPCIAKLATALGKYPQKGGGKRCAPTPRECNPGFYELQDAWIETQQLYETFCTNSDTCSFKLDPRLTSDAMRGRLPY